MAETAPGAGTTAGTAGETARIPAVIVLDFSNLTSYGGPIVGRSAAAAIAQSMQESDRWDVLSSNQVSTALTNLGLTPPLDDAAMMQLGRATEADAIVSGQVYAVNITDNPKQAKVGLRVEMRDVTSGELINGALVTAQSGVRPGFSGDSQVLVDEALRKAAFQAVNAMSENKLPKGTVLNTQVTGTGAREVLLNIGAQNGVKEGMDFIVTRNNVSVAHLHVVRVEPDQSTAVVTQSTQGAKPEDSVQAVFTLPAVSELRAAANGEVAARPARTRRSNKGFGTALAAVLGAALLIFALSGSTKSGRLTGPFNNQPAALATSSNQGAPVPPGAAVKVSWTVPNFVRSTDIIEFQIFRSDVLTTATTTTAGTTTTTAGTTTTGTTTTGTGIVPVGVAPASQDVFYDTTQARDVTFTQLNSGLGTPVGTATNPATGIAIQTATNVPGLIPGRPVTYQVIMIYQRIQANTGTGNTTTAGGTTVSTGGTTAGGTTGTTVGGTGTGGGLTTGTTTGTGTGGLTAGGTTTSASGLVYLQTPITVTGLVTPLDPPVAANPQGGATVNASSVTFDVQPSTGANQYMVELSKDPSFNTVQQIILPLQTASQVGGAVSAQNVDLTKLYPGYHGLLYWHAGARSTNDQPGPDPGRFGNASGDRRWVYSDLESLTIP